MSKSGPLSQKKVNLALQGGGAHGAYAWGALDRLLEDGRIEIEGISATSAGTMNACALAYGMHLGGPDRARLELERLWKNFSDIGLLFSPIRSLPWEKPLSGNGDYSISYFLFDSITSVFSPYQINPFNVNPLRQVIEASIDFDDLRQCKCVKLFISATHVRTGKVHVFGVQDININVVMASACLPTLYKAVEIDGEFYWDGGYTGNPALYPLFYNTDTRDIFIIHLNPIQRESLPTTAPEISNRMNEISFNSPLLLEMRAIAFVKKLLRNDMLKEEYRGGFKDILIHSLRTDVVMCDLSVASKFNTDWGFLTGLRERGREAMSQWLDKHFDDLNVRDSVDLQSDFLKSDTSQ